jgi:hypothetical protein
MDERQLGDLKHWFEAYSHKFIGADDFVNSHLRLKRDHTRRTCEEILYLANKLSLSDNEMRIAEAVALLHDVGRFPQFAVYRTYNDIRSVDHGALGVQVLREEGTLKSLDADEKLWLETAIAYHGKKSLPEHINGQALFFLKLIRDADKIDILRIVIQMFQENRENQEGAFLDLPDIPQISPEVLDSVLQRKPIEYGRLRTLNDFKLCQIGWVYDMNFPASLERLESAGILDQMFNFLPETADICEVKSRIYSYIKNNQSQITNHQ